MHFLATFLLLITTANAQPPVSDECKVYFDGSVSEEVKAKVLDAVAFLKSIEGSGGSPLHQKIFNGTVTGNTYCRFLDRNIVLFSMLPPEEQVSETQSARNTGGLIELTPRVLAYHRATLASTLIHEATHTEFPVGHVICPQQYGEHALPEPIVGKEACDESVYGAYAVQHIWAANLFKYCTNCSNEDLAHAEQQGKNGFNRVINADVRTELLQDWKFGSTPK